jgi:TATA-box binding protein (TBP) (component of TFIID and TFIIIB)
MYKNMKDDEYDIDTEWEKFLEGTIEKSQEKSINVEITELDKVPKGSELYISTKTKITYLSHAIDLSTIFWKINIIPYHIPAEGIIKKQMKFNFTDETSLYDIQKLLKDEKNVEEHIITQIINPEGRIKFKDIRKISIGLSNKDIISYRSKKKSAFYNCFVVIMRIKENNKYKEIHVKVFNTGKLEIPGIRCDKLLIRVMNLLVETLKPLTEIDDLHYNEDSCQTVLINSNFNCGFYINREKLFDILKYKYHINSVFDACSYPGIQCKYIYEDTKISFMIFRTGSVLIVGKCDDDTLYIIYDYIKNLLRTEFDNINVKNTEQPKQFPLKKKCKKRTITFE